MCRQVENVTRMLGGDLDVADFVVIKGDPTSMYEEPDPIGSTTDTLFEEYKRTRALLEEPLEDGTNLLKDDDLIAVLLRKIGFYGEIFDKQISYDRHTALLHLVDLFQDNQENNISKSSFEKVMLDLHAITALITRNRGVNYARTVREQTRRLVHYEYRFGLEALEKNVVRLETGEVTCKSMAELNGQH